MQYKLALLLLIGFALFFALRLYIGRRKLKSDVSIEIDEAYLQTQYELSMKAFGYDEFKQAWLEVSKRLGCAAGSMLLNCKLNELEKTSALPEIVTDEIEDLVGTEIWNKSKDEIDMLTIVSTYLTVREDAAHKS